jgi:glycerol-1-phosphate dehydrogenase [NAD(P)+]
LKPTLPEIYIGKDAISHLQEYIQSRDFHHFTLISDENEYLALGENVNKALCKSYNMNTIVLPSDTIPDETHLVQALLEPDDRKRIYIAVGSGTLTDIVRFASHRSGMPFISMPTAPSVDGYASSGCSLTIRKYKQTIMAAQPVAIFADLDTLVSAPRSLIAAGFGDMFGKFTALADWQLGHLLCGEAFNQEIANRSRNALNICVNQVSLLSSQQESTIQHLMEGLLEEGICMLLQGNSRPASGAEHVLSHYLEMKLAREDRLPVLHGAKVGLATILIARYYEELRQISHYEMQKRLRSVRPPDPEKELTYIRSIYGSISDKIIQLQRDSIFQTPEYFNKVCRRIEIYWDDIQTFATTVPTSEQIKHLLLQVGGVTQPHELGLTREDILEAIENAPYLRKYFTILNLSRMLGISTPENVF